MSNAIINTLIFTGSIAGQTSIQSQPIGGNLTFQLPNIPPVQGQLVTATAINGSTVVLGWSSAQSLSNIPLSALAQSGATTGQVVEWNGTAWVPSTSVPGSGTVTSVALTAPAEFTVGGSPITGAGTLAITKATQSANTVWAGPTTGSAAAPTFRALVAADIGASIVTLAAINSKVGNGNAVQLSNTGQTYAAGDVCTFDANGNTVDNSILNLNGHLIAVSPAVVSLTGATGVGIINQTSGDIALTQNGSGNITATVAGSQHIQLNTATGVFEFFGTGGGMSLASQNATIAIANTGGISITPASGTEIQLGNTALQSALHDGTDATGNAGQILSSTGGGTPTTLWIDNPSPVLYGLTGAAPATGNNHIASGSAILTQPGGSNPNQLTVTLTGNSVFSNGNYVVQLTRNALVGTAGDLSVIVVSGSQFTISSSTGDDGSTIFWTAIGNG